MNKIKPFLTVLVILLSFLVLHNALIIGIANVSSIFKKSNLDELTIKSYEAKIQSLEKSLSEYEKAHYNFSIFNSNSYILSKIALRNIYDFYDYLIISTENQVKEGSPVINEHGLVGIIETSNKSTAKVKLLTGKSDISIKVGDAYGILDGYNKQENLLIIHNINNYKNVNTEDKIFTSGLQENIPGDIEIGTVEKIEKEGVEQIIFVKPSVDFHNLGYLMVIN